MCIRDSAYSFSGPRSVVLGLDRAAGMVDALGLQIVAMFASAHDRRLQDLLDLVAGEHIRVLTPDRVDRRVFLHVQVVIGNHVAERVRPVLVGEGDLATAARLTSGVPLPRTMRTSS